MDPLTFHDIYLLRLACAGIVPSRVHSMMVKLLFSGAGKPFLSLSSKTN